MRIGSISSSFDPYRDYTAALEKSMRAPSAAAKPDTSEEPADRRSALAEAESAGYGNAGIGASAPETVSSDERRTQSPAGGVSLSDQAGNFRANPAVMEALRSVRELTETSAGTVGESGGGNRTDRRDTLHGMLSEMEDFSLNPASESHPATMDQAASFDTKRDSILQEYQYFVSPEEEQKNLEQDGIFFQKTY